MSDGPGAQSTRNKSDRSASSPKRELTHARLSFADVFAEELDAIDGTKSDGRQRPTEAALYKAVHSRPDGLPALCLSGGGIRSATFALGVMQGLAKRGLLGKFKYLSTVSGGGYIGSWLTAWIQRKTEEGTPDDPIAHVISELAGKKLPPVELKPEGVGVAVEAPAIVQLRRYSNYLAPRPGLLSADVWTLVATVLRNIILNWLVLIPVLIAALVLPRLTAAAAGASLTHWAFAMIAAGFGGCAWTIGYVSRQRVLRVGKRPEQSTILLLAVTPVWIAAILLSLGWAWWHLAPDRAVAASLSADAGALFVFGAAVMFVGWLGYTLSVFMSPEAVDPELLPNGVERILELIVYVLTGLIGGGILRLAAHAFDGTSLSGPGHDICALVYATVAAPMFLIAFTLAATIFVGFASASMSEEDREWWSRFGAWALISSVAWAGVSTVVLLLPHWIAGAIRLAVAAIATAGSGALTILGGMSKRTLFKGRSSEGDPSAKAEANANPVSWLSRAVSIALPVFIVLFGVVLSLLTDLFVALRRFHPFEFGRFTGEYLRDGLHLRLANDPFNLAIGIGAILLGATASAFVGINKFSLHAMYRNRLIRAYLGASRGKARKPDPFIGFDPQDDFSICQTKPKPGSPRPLFHVVNMTLNLVGGGELAWQERKAESMTATSLHAGTRSLGYRPVDEYGGLGKASGGEGHPLTLGTAMAISGAAASPNMGYHSSPALTFVLTLFNARLGWWLGNPSKDGESTYFRESPKWALEPLFAEAFGQTDEKHPYVHVSDGGHFENLGLYEMVRRRCRLIVVVDAGADPERGYDDLSAAIRKIRSDMGIRIELPDEAERLIFARSAGKGSVGRMAILGKIRYGDVDPNGTDGDLIYVKPAYYGVEEPLDLINYAQAHTTFPHEPTADQFFSESQFESYRALGEFAIQKLCAKLDPANDGSLDEFIISVSKYLNSSGTVPPDRVA